jgi:hypothetical protein
MNQNPEQQSQKGEQPKAQFTSLDKFPLLYAEFQKIIDVFDSPPQGQVKKLVWQFNFDGGAVNGQPTLNGYPARQNGELTTLVPVITLSKSSLFANLLYPLLLNNLELTRDDYKSLLDDINKKTFLYFIPIKSKMQHCGNVVTYTTAWSNSGNATIQQLVPITSLGLGDELNPSPPKNPYY